MKEKYGIVEDFESTKKRIETLDSLCKLIDAW